MAEPVEITYRAFLSYSHKDTEAAAWLHKKLERWRVDRNFVGRETAVGIVPKSLRPIFRDRDDFAGGSSLEDATIAALEASKFLIVLCSPNAAASTYVNEEVRLFKALGRSDRVIPVIIAGEPGGAVQECFPPSVKFTVDEQGRITDKLAEPVAPDFRDIGDGRERAAAKVVAGMLGVRYDEIMQRAKIAARKRKLRSAIAGTSFVVLASVGGYYYWQSIHLATQQELSKKEIKKLQGLVKNLLSTSANASEAPGVADELEKALSSAQRQANAGDKRMSRALELLGQGKITEAEGLFQEVADDNAARIAKAEAYVEKGKVETAAAFRNLGAIARLADPKRARTAYTQALKFEPDHADALYWHGTLHLRSGDLPVAEKSLSRLMDVSTASGDKRGLYRAHLRLGEIVKDRGSLEAALKHQQQAIAIARERLDAQPADLERQRDVSVSYEKIGDVQRALGDLTNALASYRNSLTIAERLATNDPSNTGWQRDLSVSFDRVGNVQKIQGDLDGALTSYRDSLAIRERLTDSDPKNALWQRDLSVSYNKVGGVQKAQGDLSGALKTYRDSLAITERLAASDSKNAGWQRDLAVSHSRVGDVQMTQGDLNGALSSNRSTLEIISRLADADPENAGRQLDLSVSYNNVGDVQKALGDLRGALKLYRDSLTIRQRLAATDPKNAGWQRNLSVSYENVGNVQVIQGDLTEAFASFRDSLAIRQRLATSDPENASWQRDLALAHWRLAENGEEPKTHWQAVVNILKALNDAGRLSPTDRKRLPVAETNLAAASE